MIAEYTEEATPTSRLQWRKSFIYMGERLLSTLTLDATGAGNTVEFHHPDRLGTRLISHAETPDVQEKVTLPFGTGATSLGGFLEGAFASNIFNYVGGVPTQTTQPAIGGAFAGGGGGIYVTNARSSQQLAGPFQTITINVGIGPAKGSIQVSFAGSIWQASFTVGPGVVASASRVTTFTKPTTTGCQ